MEDKKKGRRYVPSFIPLEKDVIKTVNTFDGDKHMRAVRKPGDDKVYLYVSPLFHIAIQDFTRGRYSKETYAKKSEFTKFMDEKIPAKTRSHIKKYVQPKTQNIMGTEMHLVDLPYMTDNGSIYEMPFGKKRPEGEALSTSLFENKNTMKISELRTIIREEITKRLSEEEKSLTSLEDIAIAFKKSIDSDDRLSITVLPPTKLDGKMYYGIEQDDPERFNEFKYGAYAVKEAWGPVSRILGISSDEFDKINKIVSALRDKKLIDLEW